MMNIMDRNATIGGVVAELPQAASIFNKYGIDYCCGGNRRLYDVINEQKMDEKAIYEDLEKALTERKNGYANQGDFTAMEPSALSTYIEDTHHSYLRRSLPETAEILNVVLRAHGKNHTELFHVYRLFGTLKTDLEQHLLKEETMLFPALAETGVKEEILELTTDIINEHVAAGDILSELRNITNNYQVPSDACPTFERAYEMLEELEQDLHQHIHLENNILLKDYDQR